MTDLKTKRWFYEHNKDFRQFVDKCCTQYNKTITEMLQQTTTEEYYLSLIKGGCNYRQEKTNES